MEFVAENVKHCFLLREARSISRNSNDAPQTNPCSTLCLWEFKPQPCATQIVKRDPKTTRWNLVEHCFTNLLRFECHDGDREIRERERERRDRETENNKDDAIMLFSVPLWVYKQQTWFK